jgi:hypothetical protein
MGFDFWRTTTTYLQTRGGQSVAIGSKSAQGYGSELDAPEFEGVDPEDSKELNEARAMYRARYERPMVVWQRANADEQLRGLWRKAADERGICPEDVVKVYTVETRSPR